MRRRPLLFVAVSFVAAVLIEYYLGTVAAVCTGIVLTTAVYYSQKQESFEKKRMVAGIILISYFLGVTFFFIQSVQLESSQDKLLNSYDSEEAVSIMGKVLEVEKKSSESGDEYLQMVIETEDGRLLAKYYVRESDYDHEKITVQDEQAIIPGWRIKCQGNLSIPQGRRNPGCFDYALYLKSQDIPVVMTVNSLEVTSDKSRKALTGRLYLIKESFLEEMQKTTDTDTEAMIRAIMFGDKGELDEDVLDVFQRNGTAHILAVSGLHIGIIYGFILKVWTLIGKLTAGLLCGRKGGFFFCFNIAFFGSYTVMAGFSPSVVRAVIMVLLHVFATLTNRRYDLGNAALAVMLIVLMINPYMLFNAGFQMSFLAVLTLMLVLPFVRHVYSGIFLSSLVVQIGLGPFVIYNFNYLSVVSVFINVPVIYLAGFIVPAGLVSIAFAGLPLFFLSAKATQFLCSLLQFINDAAEIRGITTFQVSSPPLWFISFYYLALLTLATEEGRLAVIRAAQIGYSAAEKLRERAAYVVKVCIVLLLISIAFAHVAGDDFDDCNLTFVDVGQGDCMCIQAGGTYLIDGGGNVNYNLGKKTLKCYLLKNGMSHVDAAFVTHLHTDHYKGICELCQEGMVKKIFVYEGNRALEKQITEETDLDAEKIEYVTSGQSISLGSGGFFNRHSESIEVLWPARKTESEYAGMLEDEEDENAMSLVFKVHFSNRSLSGNKKKTTLLVTGDMGEDGEKELIDESKGSLASTILKVGHHGSKYSSSDSFLDEISPEYAVIQVGKNTYGHPTPETLSRLKERKIKTYRNDTEGAIGFEIKKGVVKNVMTMINGDEKNSHN